MSFIVMQTGATLQFMDSSGVISNLTLPTGVTLRTDVPPRWTVFNNFACLVNTPSTPLTVDASGTVRPLTPKPPAVAPIVSAGAAGALTGTYAALRYTFVIKDSIGNLIAESDFSPISNSVTLSAQKLHVAGILPSSEPISARRLYRPQSNGAVLFGWADIDGNVITTFEDDQPPDAALAFFPAPPDLGTPPHLVLLKEWRNLLWGVSDLDLDTVRASSPSGMWKWPVVNSSLLIPGTGRDAFGIKSLMPRREALGIARRDIIWQVTGTSFADFRVVKLSENTGVESNETVKTYHDIVFWLWKDGVYQWDDNGIVNISDLGGVKTWFNTNSYFNRDQFPNAFAEFDPIRLKYKLFVAGAGSTTIDHWVEYDLETKTWWGPHKTDAFTPTCAFILTDSSDKVQAVVGSSNAFVWKEQDLATDDAGIGIATELQTRFYDGGVPDLEKYWSQLSISGKVQTSGILNITPTVGYLNDTAQLPISYDMTLGRQKLRRLGRGKLAQLAFTHSTAGEPVELYQFMIPWHIVGRR